MYTKPYAYTPLHPTLTHTRLPASPQEPPPTPRRTKSSLANLLIANHSPWKLQIFNFIWHWNRWEASGSQRDKTNLWKADERKLGHGSGSVQESGGHVGLRQASAGYRGSRGSRRTPGHHAGTGTLRDAVAATLQLPSLAKEGGLCPWARNTKGREQQGQIVKQGCPSHPPCQSNSRRWRQALPEGLARTPPLQVEKGMFPPRWVGRSGAPAAVLLRALPCISVVTPVLGPGPDAADGHKE